MSVYYNRYDRYRMPVSFPSKVSTEGQSMLNLQVLDLEFMCSAQRDEDLGHIGKSIHRRQPSWKPQSDSHLRTGCC